MGSPIALDPGLLDNEPCALALENFALRSTTGIYNYLQHTKETETISGLDDTTAFLHVKSLPSSSGLMVAKSALLIPGVAQEIIYADFHCSLASQVSMGRPAP